MIKELWTDWSYNKAEYYRDYQPNRTVQLEYSRGHLYRWRQLLGTTNRTTEQALLLRDVLSTVANYKKSLEEDLIKLSAKLDALTKLEQV